MSIRGTATMPLAMVMHPFKPQGICRVAADRVVDNLTAVKWVVGRLAMGTLAMQQHPLTRTPATELATGMVILGMGILGMGILGMVTSDQGSDISGRRYVAWCTPIPVRLSPTASTSITAYLPIDLM